MLLIEYQMHGILNSLDKRILIVFAREPALGKVKTRLLKDLPADAATSLYKAFVKDVMHMASLVDCEQKIIYYTGSNRLKFLGQFRKDFQFKKQQGQDLGLRMYNAFRYCQREGINRVIIIGTDCLTLSPSEIQLAFKRLLHSDCVLGPSVDGGYYLIGLKEASQELFKDIHWSSADVLKQTLQKVKNEKKTFFLLKRKEDIDEIKALRRVARNIKKQKSLKHTALIVRSIFNK